jgi:hypothetical protein
MRCLDDQKSWNGPPGESGVWPLLVDFYLDVPGSLEGLFDLKIPDQRQVSRE